MLRTPFAFPASHNPEKKYNTKCKIRFIYIPKTHLKIYVIRKIKYLYSTGAHGCALGTKEEQQDTDIHIFSICERMHT